MMVNVDSVSTNEINSVDIIRIMQMIPHRYPMLMIDKVKNMVPDQTATGIKNVTINENQFIGHFPTRPVMPGVMIIESIAQTAAVLVVHSLGPVAEGKLVYFMSIDNAKFRKPVIPGDTMYVNVKIIKRRNSIWKISGEVYVDETLVSEAQITAMVVGDE